MKRLAPLIAKQLLSKFRMEWRVSILDAVRLGDRSREELETWALFCACLAWGKLETKRSKLMNFYRKISSFMEFLQNPSLEQLTVIYPGEGSKQLLGLCFAIRDVVNEFGSLSEFAEGQKSVTRCIFKLANTLRNNLEKYPPIRKFNLPTVKPRPPLSPRGKRKMKALKRYCMYLRWMVRDSEPDFGVWNFFNKKDLLHPIDTHVARILKRWRVLTDDEANWFNVEKVTEYFREVEPGDPTKFDYHLVTFGQRFCRKNNPSCNRCLIKLKFNFNCNLKKTFG